MLPENFYYLKSLKSSFMSGPIQGGLHESRVLVFEAAAGSLRRLSILISRSTLLSIAPNVPEFKSLMISPQLAPMADSIERKFTSHTLP